VTLVHEGRLDAARAALQRAVQLDPGLAPAHANLAYVFAAQDRMVEAEREYREAINLQPDNAVPYNGLSVVLFELGRFKDMERACRNAISRYQLRDRFLGLFYVQLAIAHHQQGREEQAVEAVSRARALGVAEHPAFATIEMKERGDR
jgi:superkiller protein 3